MQIIGIIIMLSLVSVMFTTAEERQAAKERMRRYNPLFIGLIIAQLAVVTYFEFRS